MTELIWDEKYKDGKKQGPVRVALPFQSIETVNESAQDRQRTLELFATGRDPEWRNRLIWGDNKYVLPSLLPEFSGRVDLIYIDPPFTTGQDFSYLANIPDYADTSQDGSTTFVKEPSILEQKAYRDTWGKGLDSYLQMMYERLTLMYELLSDKGSLYIHLDDHVSHYVKVVADEVFGAEAFINEIAWQRTNAHNMKMRYYPRVHDVLLFYVKSSAYCWNPPLGEHSPEQLKRYRPDENGRLYTGQDLTVSSKSQTRRDAWRGTAPPPGRSWAASLEERERLWTEGRILVKADGTPRLDGYKVYLDEKLGRKIASVWTDIGRVGNTSDERLDFATQKPEALLERIISTSSSKGTLVADFFCGSGTTMAVAEKLGRCWIGCDLSRFAIHTSRKRLLRISGVKPFVVQNLGKYERQAWQAAEFPGNGKNRLEEQRLREAAYRRFVLDLYHAEPTSGNSWLHGSKGGRMVHVGAVDAPVTLADVKAISREAWKAIGTGKSAPSKAGVDILGWEFAFELNEVAKQVAAESRVDVAFKKIPREVLDKKAVEQGDVKFFELGALFVGAIQKGREVTLKLTDFVIPTDDVPEEARKAIKHWSQLIDYWAVDWDFKNDSFHNQWQTYRTRKEPEIVLETEYGYPKPGRYTIAIKVIDILGNDTTKTFELKLE